MRNPTCYARFDGEGTTFVWTLCPACAAEIVIHPQPGREGSAALPWYEIICSNCGRKASALGYGPET